MAHVEPLPQGLFELLAFESSWRSRGNGRVKSDAARERFGISMHTYYLRLNAAIEHPSAERLFGVAVRQRRALLARRKAL